MKPQYFRRWRSHFFAVAALLVFTAFANAQEAKPLVFSGELTAKDPFDKVRKKSHHKVHELKLKQGEIYLIDLRGVGFDSYLRIEDEAGMILAENDDVGELDLNSRLGFAPKKTGTYRAIVTSFPDGETGKYTLTVGGLKKAGGPKTLKGKLTEKAQKTNDGQFTEVFQQPFKAGEVWLMDLMSKDFDPLLAVANPKKKLIVLDDDGGEGLNSRLVVAIGETGDHFIQIVALKPGTNGDYTLRIQRMEPLTAVELTQEEKGRQELLQLIVRGMQEREAGKMPLAAESFRKSLELVEKLYPKEKFPKGSDLQASVLVQMAMLHVAKGELANAEALFKQGLEIRGDVLGKKHADYALILNNLASLYSNRGEFAKAEPYLKESLEIARHSLGEDNPEFLQHLNNLAYFYQIQRQFAQAETLAKQAVEIGKRIAGEKHSTYASLLSNLAEIYQAQGDPAKAEPLFKQALEIDRPALGNKHATVMNRLILLGGVYAALNDYAKAEPFLREALEICRQVLPPSHPQLSHSVLNLGETYRKLDEIAKAEALLKEGVALRKRYLGEKHADYAVALHGLAILWESQGDIATAVSLYEKAIEIRRPLPEGKHPDTAVMLFSLGSLYQIQGNYAKAEPLYRLAVEILENYPGGKQNPFYQSHLNNLAALSQQQGDYAKAEQLFQKLLDLERDAKGKKHSGYAANLSNLASVYLSQGEFAKAEKLQMQALEIDRQTRGPKHPEVALRMNNLAHVYIKQKKKAEAETLLKDALEILTISPKENRELYATCVNNLSSLYRARKDHVKGLELLMEASETLKKVAGENHPSLAAMLSNIALAYTEAGDSAKAEPLARQAVLLLHRNMEESALVQSERQQIARRMQEKQFLANYLYVTYKDPTPSADGYDLVLSWKGSVTTRQRLNRVARTEFNQDPAATRLFNDLDRLSRQISTWSSMPHDKIPKGVDLAKKLESLAAEREEVEAKLSERTEAYRKVKQSMKVTTPVLQKHLPEGAVLIDFIEFEERLTAFVVTRDSLNRLEFGKIKGIAEAIDQFRLTLKRGTPLTGKDDPARVLRAKLLDPLEPYLAKAKLVLIAPDGPLHGLPFAALPSRDGESFLIEQVPIVIVPVPQMLPELLASPEGQANAPPSLLVLGDVDFDADLGNLAKKAPSEAGQILALAAERTGVKRQWGRLPGTVGELESIEKLFRTTRPKGLVTTLNGEAATESNLRAKTPGHQYLHLATHGFFAPKELKRLNVADDGDGSGRQNRQVLGHSPGLLSGLVLAGANRGGDSTDDGILTALEVGELDLTKVRLAVLSACETGLGETAGGEGVLGLQRALQVAGAKTVVTTLWSIPDEPTRVLMERFYENQWTKKMSKLDALVEAQQWMLREGRSNAGVARGVQRLEKTPEPVMTGRLPPYYWAAFVLSGDWR